MKNIQTKEYIFRMVNTNQCIYITYSNLKEFEYKIFQITKFLEIVNSDIPFKKSNLKGNFHHFIFYVFFEIRYTKKIADPIRFYFLEKKLMQYIQLFLLDFKLRGKVSLKKENETFQFPLYTFFSKDFNDLQIEKIIKKNIKGIKKSIQYFFLDYEEKDNSCLITEKKYEIFKKFLLKKTFEKNTLNVFQLIEKLKKDTKFIDYLKKNDKNNNFYSYKNSINFIFIWLASMEFLLEKSNQYNYGLNESISILFTKKIIWTFDNEILYEKINQINSFLLNISDILIDKILDTLYKN